MPPVSAGDSEIHEGDLVLGLGGPPCFVDSSVSFVRETFLCWYE